MNYKPHEIVLKDLKNFLQELQPKAFTKKNKTLSNSSIGEHFRHIIEFYQCCLLQKDSGIINYDLRKRNKKLEEDLDSGIHTINILMNRLKEIRKLENCTVLIQNGIEKTLDEKEAIQSSFFRELAYCLDHCIHHQSLIKIALLELKLNHLINENFGVAFSTQNYRKQCVS